MVRMVSAAELLSPLDGREYASYRDLQRAVLEQFNKRIGEVPPGYTYQHLIDWAQQRHWITRNDGRFALRIQRAA